MLFRVQSQPRLFIALTNHCIWIKPNTPNHLGLLNPFSTLFYCVFPFLSLSPQRGLGPFLCSAMAISKLLCVLLLALLGLSMITTQVKLPFETNHSCIHWLHLVCSKSNPCFKFLLLLWFQVMANDAAYHLDRVSISFLFFVSNIFHLPFSLKSVKTIVRSRLTWFSLIFTWYMFIIFNLRKDKDWVMWKLDQMNSNAVLEHIK